MALADRIAVMDHGRLLQVATPSQLYREPADEMVAASSAKAWCCRREVRRRRRRRQLPRRVFGQPCGCAARRRSAPAPRARACARDDCRSSRPACRRIAARSSAPSTRAATSASRRVDAAPEVRCTHRARAIRAAAGRRAARSRARRLGDPVVTMRLALHGGFGEKGRTCIGVAHDGFRVLLDAGVKTSAAARRLLSAIAAAALAARRDHRHARARRSRRRARLVPRQGFAGRILMTHETRRGCATCSPATPSRSSARRAPRIAVEPLAVGADRASGRCGSPPAARGTSPAACGACSTTAACASAIAATSCRRAPCSRWTRCRRATRSRSTPRMATTTCRCARAQPRSRAGSPRIRSGVRAADAAVRPLGRAARARARAARARAGHARGAAARRSTSATGCVGGACPPRRAARGGAATGSAGDRCRRAALLCHDGMGMAGPARRARAARRAAAIRPLHRPRARGQSGAACSPRAGGLDPAADPSDAPENVALAARQRARAGARAFVRSCVARAARAAHPRPAHRRRHRRLTGA